MGNRSACARPDTDDTVRIDGTDFTKWLVNPSADRVSAYAAAGIRTHRRGDTLLVHCFDEGMTRDIDRAAGD
jgi:hypothetical protein